MKPHSTMALPILLASVLWLGAPAPAAEINGAMDTQWIEDLGGTVVKDPDGVRRGVHPGRPIKYGV